MGEIVAQLNDVRERLAAAAVTAMRAKADAEQAHRQYTEAAKGTDHPQIRKAIADIRTASKKSTKVAQLMEEARGHFAAYLDTIAPGSVPDRDVPEKAMPSGDRLLQEAERRSDTRKSVASFLTKAVRNAENVQDTAKSVTELGEKGIKIFRSPSGPTGSQSTGTPTTPSAALPPARSKVDLPDAVGQLIIIGVIISVAAQRTDRLIRKGIARLRTRERTDRT